MFNSSCAIHKLEGITAFSVNILSAFLGSLGNMLVCFTVYSSHRLHKPWCYFICSLSLADLLVNLVVQPMEAILTFTRMKGVCQHTLRDAFRLAAYITCGASLMNLAFMSVERCLAMVWPLKQRQFQHLTRRKFLTSLAMIWGVPCLLAFPGLIVGKGTRLTSILILIGLVSCYGVILTSYGILFMRTRAHFKVHQTTTLTVREFEPGKITVNKRVHSPKTRRKSETYATEKGRESTTRVAKKKRESDTQAAKKRRESEKRAARTIAVVIALFTVSWVPYGYVLVSDPEQNINSFYVWAVTVALTNSAVNPVVYFLSNKVFRKSSMRVLSSLFCCCKDN